MSLLRSILKQGGGINSRYPQVDYYSNLPISVPINSIYVVRNPTTETKWILFTKILYQAGYYRWSGISWIYEGNVYDNLYEMNDVGLTSPIDKQSLIYDSINSRWINELTTRVIYSQIEEKTITNTSTETSFINTNNSLGSLTINSDRFKIGKCYKVFMSGHVSTDGGDTSSTIKIKIGSTIIVSSLGTLPNNLSGSWFETDFNFVIKSLGSSGTLIGQGRSVIQSTTGISGAVSRFLKMSSPQTFNSNINNTIDITYQWTVANASHSITVTNLYIQELN